MPTSGSSLSFGSDKFNYRYSCVWFIHGTSPWVGSWNFTHFLLLFVSWLFIYCMLPFFFLSISISSVDEAITMHAPSLAPPSSIFFSFCNHFLHISRSPTHTYWPNRKPYSGSSTTCRVHRHHLQNHLIGSTRWAPATGWVSNVSPLPLPLKMGDRWWCL